MNKRLWNLKLTATDDYGETTIERVSNEVGAQLLRGLMYGPGSSDYKHVLAAVERIRTRRDDHSLAA